MNEAETRADHIDPALKAAGWGVVEGSRILREYEITKGRLEGHGRRAKAQIADYVLVYRNHMLAVTAGSRLSAIGMVLAGIIALVVLGWMEPEYIETFMKHPKGPWLLAASVILQIIGGMWVWKILKPVA